MQLIQKIKDNWFTIAGVVVVLFLLWLFVFGPRIPSRKTSVAEQRLQHQNDSLAASNQNLTNTVDSLKDENDIIKNQKKEIETRIINNIIYRDKIIKSYDTATTKQLRDFFTERYER